MKRLKGTIELHGRNEDVFLELRKYTNNGRLAVCLTSRNGDEETAALTTLSVNFPYCELDTDQFICKGYSENEEIDDAVMAGFPGVFEDTGRTVQMGYVEAKVWRVADDSGFEPIE